MVNIGNKDETLKTPHAMINSAKRIWIKSQEFENP
jgi:hypothetical protein